MVNVLLFFLLATISREIQAASVTGYVTPTSVGMTITSVSLYRLDHTQVSVLSQGSYVTSFAKTGGASIGTITMPEGRYAGAAICTDPVGWTVTVNAEVYAGTNGSWIDQTPLTSVGVNSTDPFSMATSGTATALADYALPIQDVSGCYDVFFATPVCVSTSATNCGAGDSFVNAATAGGSDLNLVMDLYRAIGVDAAAADQQLLPLPVVFPIAVPGNIGAAIHLESSVSGSVGEILVLLDANKRILFAGGFSNSSLPGFCPGVSMVNGVTAVPSGSYLNPVGPTGVATYDVVTGKVQYVAGVSTRVTGGAFGTGSTPYLSSGVMVLDNVLQAVGSTVNATCVADGSIPALGFTYSDAFGAAGVGSAGTTSFTITKITDPANILGTCPGATCGTYP